MRSLLAVFVLGFMAVTAPVQASDCGLPPAALPAVPDGSSASGAALRDAASAVREYSTSMTAYLDCLEMNSNELHLNMSKEQQVRWTEDFNTMAETVTNLEIQMNEQIRIYNEKRRK